MKKYLKSENLKELMFNALKSKYQSDLENSLANLKVYFENPTGIGEHSEIMEEMQKLHERVSHANDCLQNLDELKDFLLNK
jgi:hypothetical protein